MNNIFFVAITAPTIITIIVIISMLLATHAIK